MPFVIYVACFASSESQLRKEYQRMIHERTRNKTKLNSSDFAVFRVISWIAFALTRPFENALPQKRDVWLISALISIPIYSKSMNSDKQPFAKIKRRAFQADQETTGRSQRENSSRRDCEKPARAFLRHQSRVVHRRRRPSFRA